MQVHRFGDLIAVHVNRGGPCAYLTAAEARWLASALNKAALDTASRPFGKSTCGTHSRELPAAAFTSTREI